MLLSLMLEDRTSLKWLSHSWCCCISGDGTDVVLGVGVVIVSIGPELRQSCCNCMVTAA